MDLSFNEECIKAHNDLRVLHRAKNVKFCKQLAEEAQEWAEKIVITRNVQHSDPKNQYGENLATSTIQKNGMEFTMMWYKEIFDYKFEQERQEIMKIGHFSQVVWTNCTDAGFGKAYMDEKKGWVVVGRYKPVGNVIGQFLKNVGVPIPGWANSKIIRHMLDSCPDKHKTEFYRKYAGDHVPSKQGFDSINRNESTKMNNDSFNKNNKDIEDSIIKPTKYQAEETKPSLNNLSDDEYDQNLIPLRKKNIEVHNSFRKNHRAKELKVNMKLNTMAQKWAEKLANTQQLSYSNELFNGEEVGENISILYGEVDDDSIERVLNKWYNEKKNYKQNLEVDDVAEFGHFTQMVWLNSKEIGTGIAKCDNGPTIMVCYYSPPGNVKGEFKDNVRL